MARRKPAATVEYLSSSSDKVFKPSVLSVSEDLMAERLSLATVTEMAATTAGELRGNVAKNDGTKRAEAEQSGREWGAANRFQQ